MKKQIVGWVLSVLVAVPAWAIVPEARIELNQATHQQLSVIKGLGGVRGQAMVQNRIQNGPYRSWLDVVVRNPGISPRVAEKMGIQGVVVNNQPFPPSPPSSPVPSH